MTRVVCPHGDCIHHTMVICGKEHILLELGKDKICHNFEAKRET